MKRGGILQRMRTAGLLLALFALTFKALLPPGFMLDASAERVAITLCGGGAAYFDPQTGEISHHDQTPTDQDSSEHCPFAVAAAAALTSPDITPSAPAFYAIAAEAPLARTFAKPNATGPPLPARGPPLLA